MSIRSQKVHKLAERLMLSGLLLQNAPKTMLSYVAISKCCTFVTPFTHTGTFHKLIMYKQLVLHVDQVPTLSRRGAVCLLNGALRVRLILVVALVLDGFGAAVRVAVIVEEAAEGELVEGVLGVFAVAEPAVEGVVVVVFALAVGAPQFIRIHRVEVGGVRGMGDGGDVRCLLLPEVAGEVDGFEERMSFDFIRAVLTQSILGAAAQFDDEIGRLRAELGWKGNVQRALPVDHLSNDMTLTLRTTCNISLQVLHIPSAVFPGG